MIKKFNLKLIVFLIAWMSSMVLSAQINSTTAVVPFGANPGYGFGIMPSSAVLPSGGTYGKSQDAANAYNDWKSAYMESCGGGMIRIKFDEPNRTVSEGIAYGMLLSAYAADKPLFDGLYTYWKNFKSPSTSGRNGKLMNWRIEGCGPTVSGTGSAADADVDVAWALMIAKTQWPTSTTFNYGTEASDIIQSIKDLEFNSAGQLINGDGWGFGNDCRNPSYQAPAYYPYFNQINTNFPASKAGAYNLINNNVSTKGLVSDWSSSSGARNTCNPGGTGQPPTDGYGYDASRNPWRMAQDVIWNNEPGAKTLLTNLTSYLSGRGAGNVGGPVYQDGSNYAGYTHNATFVSMFAVAVMGSPSTNQAFMDAMYLETKKTVDQSKPGLSGYFGNTLRAISMFMMTGNFWKYGTTSVQEINVRIGTVNVLADSTYDFQNQQISPPATSGKAVVFTIENLGFAALNLTGTTKVALSGPDAAQFSVVQPTASSLPLGATAPFTVTFTPTTLGTKTATLTIANNDPNEGVYIIKLTGTGTPTATAPKMTVYDTINVLTSGSAFPMGAFTSGGTGNRILKIKNTGDAPLNINGVTFSNIAFSLIKPTAANLPLIIPVGGTGYLTIGYLAPATAATTSGTATIATTDPNSASFVLNLTASSIACSANPSNKIIMDYDGNRNVILAFAPKGAFSSNTTNPFPTGINVSPTVASYERPCCAVVDNPLTTTINEAWNGDYDIIRYYNCGTVGTTYVPFVITAANPAIQVSFYSPAVGIPVTLAPQKPGATANSWAPLISDYSSNVTVSTTKANQWEVLTFDMSKLIAAGVTADFKALDLQIDPERAYSKLAANAAASARTFYIDDIKYGINPCINDLSGVLQDFDTHTNTTLEYAVNSLAAPIANPVSGTANNSANVGQFTKTINAATFDDGFRYVGCSNKIDLSTKKYISMLVYSPVANAPIQMSAKIPDGSDLDVYPDDAAANTQLTVFANKWHRVYFDLSTIPAASLSSVYALDIFFDPSDLSGVAAPNNKFYFDDIRLESTLPCVAGIPATNILNDFEDNRYMGVVFPGATGLTYFNTIKANPASGGINTSAIVGEFLRGTASTGTSARFAACQAKLDLSAGSNIIDLKVYSPNANVAITMSLKNAAGVSLSDVTDTVKLANTWTNLRFDHTNLLNSTDIAFIDVIVDGAATFSGTTTTAAARTYLFDDLKYSAPSPEINVKALTSPKTTDIPSTTAFAMGTAAIGDSTSMTFSILNNGLLTLNLTGTPTIKVGGANPADFIVVTTQTFSTSIDALNGTGFTVYFKPTAGGARSASLTISNNDANEGTYVIYLNGIGTSSVIKVLDGATGTSPIIATNNTTPINVGTSAVNVAATPAYTMSIKNNGLGPLKITGIIPSAGFTVTALSPAGDILTGTSATFTITGTPAATGINTGTLTITSNDPVTPSYKVNITVTGSVPVISVLDAAATVVANNNTTAVSVGTATVATAATPAYTFTIKNTGSAPLSITSVTPTTGFTVTAVTPATAIAAGGSATFTVTGTPALTGVNPGSITIVSTDPATPSYKVNVSVTGTAAATAAVQVLDGTTIVPNNNTTAITLPSPVVNTASAAKTFTIKNTGTAPLTVGTITASTGFTVTPVTPAGAIAAGGTATFTVSGTPTSTTVATTGVITIPSDDPATPYTVNVSVIGTSAPTAAVQVLDGTTIVPNNNTTAITLPSPVVNTASAAKTFTIKNTGTAPLTVGTITASTGFTVTPVTPAGSIAAGGTATFTVSGTPTSTTVATTGVITIPSNDPATPYTVNVSVIGTAAATAAVQVLDGTTIVPNNNTTAITLPSPVVNTASAAKTFTIKNTGTAPLTVGTITASTGFTVTPVTPAGAISPGGTATFTVSGTPTSTTVATTGVITIPSDDPATPYTVNVSVIGTSVPTAAVQVLDGTTIVPNNNTSAVVLPSPAVNTASTPKTFTIKNTGTASLTVGTITAPTGFTVTQVSPAGSIAAGGTATFTVSGTPTSTTVPTTGVITIPSDDPATPYTLNVYVIGTAAAIATAEVLDGTTTVANNNTTAVELPSPVVNTASAPKTFTIKNTGGAPLTIGTITAPTGFTVTQVSPAGSIAAGGTATFTVSGTPTSTTVETTGAITIPSNDPATPYTVNVSVIGTASAVAAVEVLDGATIVPNNNTTAVVLPSSAVNTASTPKTITIKNTGTAPLTVSGVIASAGFTATQVSPAGSIAAGGTATFTVSGTPTSSTVETTGTITITSDDPASPYTVNVSVIGTAAAIATVEVLDGTTTVANNNPTAIELPSPVVNTASTPKTFTIKNTGGAPLTVGTITAPTGFTVTQVSPAGSIAAGGTATFTVSGTPTSTTVATTGVITIPSNDPATPYTVNVSVIGTATATAIAEVLDGATTVPNNNTTAVELPSPAVNTASTPKTFTIRNSGSAPLTVGTISASTGFTVTQVSPAGSIAAGGTATFTVSGTPTSSTVATTGSITIPSNDPASPYTIKVSVIGTAAGTATAAVLDGTTTVPNNNTTAIELPSPVVNTASAPKTFTIKNTGGAPLTVGTITASTGFAVTQISPAGTIAAGGTATFTVTGTPTSTTVATTGVITIPSNDPATPYTVNISVIGKTIPAGGAIEVRGKSSQIVANNSTFIIGSNTINTPTAPYTFNIFNQGTTDLIITNVVATPGFSATQPFPKTIAPGASQTFTVTGIPNDASATRNGTITILSNDPQGAFTINVGVNVGVPTGVRALSSTEIELFPNPTALGYSNIEFNGSFDEVVVTVYTADGSKAFVKELSSVIGDTRQLEIQDLPSGVYFVEVSTAQGKIIKRLIKQ